MKILVVDDEVRIARAIKQGLEQEGYAVDMAHDGEDGYNAAHSDEYDAIVLDVMMPQMNGFDVARKLRAGGDHTPILMLTAKDQNRDIVEGLDSGADDYLAKPFSFDVLTARVRALLRRPQDSISNILKTGDVSMDLLQRRVTRSGQDINLSGKEFAILEYLLRNKNRILSKHNIMTHVWDFDADILPNNVEVFINYLRGKIDKPFPRSKPLIQTVRGFGYVIKDDEAT
ncbi:MAG: response regulator transcription factor [Candidatus Saccharimonas sp.]